VNKRAEFVAGLEQSAFWMPFTANRQFKKSPRLLARAEGTQLDAFFALELSTAAVAQLRGPASAARAAFA